MSDQEAALQRYAELKQQISNLEKELDELKEQVFQSVDGAGGQFDHQGFVLKTQKRPKYKFSDDYEAKNKQLKELKKAEIESGAATIDGYSEFVTVKFKD
ncbi:MAG: hypothetical protein AB8B91_21265 [Rubripirellula sp.]